MSEDGRRLGAPPRREILAALGTVAAGAGLAGCTGGDDGSDADGTDDADGDPADGDGTDGADGGSDDGAGGDGEDAPDRAAETPPPSSTSLVNEGPTVGLERVAGGMGLTTDMAATETGPELCYVTDQTGKVWVIEDGERHEEPMLDVGDRIVELGIEEWGGGDERGLNGIELHPDFTENGRFFLRYSRVPDGDYRTGTEHVEVLAEFRANDDLTSVDPETEELLLELPNPNVSHNSGNVLFGPDGYLYVPTGDGGFETFPDDGIDPWHANPERPYAQDTSEMLLGGILRIDVDGEGDDRSYAIPEDNPLVDEPDHRDEYYAWGFRNPWGSSFDGDELYVGNVGEASYEEVHRVERGGNYGWPIREGTHCWDIDAPGEPPEQCATGTPDDVRGGESFEPPIVEYPHRFEDTSIGHAVVGGYVYRGDELPELQGRYVFADNFTHWAGVAPLFVADPQDDADPVHEYNEERDLWQLSELLAESDDEGELTYDGQMLRQVGGMAEDRHGELYVLTHREGLADAGDGEVLRITSAE